MKIKNINESYIYLFSSLMVVILNFFFMDLFNREFISYVLIFFIIFFGLPHGALDTLLAKQNGLYGGFYSFIFFNLVYLFTIVAFFFLWLSFPIISLSIFLIISIFHFSEDWKLDINLFQRLILSTSLISLIIFFQTREIESIFFILTKSNSIEKIILFFFYLSYLLLVFIAFIFFSNLKNKYLLLNIITIFLTALTLNPLLYFLCYFCFFHSIKNYRQEISFFNIESNKVKNKILIINLFINLFLSLVFFNFFLKDSFEQKLIQITFIGLASLTIPHMLLKAIINYRIK